MRLACLPASARAGGPRMQCAAGAEEVPARTYGPARRPTNATYGSILVVFRQYSGSLMLACASKCWLVLEYIRLD